MQVTPLFSEEVYPVCSPAYLAKYPALTEAKDLASCTWLVLDDSQRDWIGWSDWLQSQGLKGLEPKRRININSYSMVIQSAINGQGIALAWSNLVDDYLNSGALVRPLDAVLRTDAQFCLLEPLARGGMRQSVKRFRSWLMNQLPATLDQ
jgi:DNA-binding transcriptional LysR family regulator